MNKFDTIYLCTGGDEAITKKLSKAIFGREEYHVIPDISINNFSLLDVARNPRCTFSVYDYRRYFYKSLPDYRRRDSDWTVEEFNDGLRKYIMSIAFYAEKVEESLLESFGLKHSDVLTFLQKCCHCLDHGDREYVSKTADDLYNTFEPMYNMFVSRYKWMQNPISGDYLFYEIKQIIEEFPYIFSNLHIDAARYCGNELIISREMPIKRFMNSKCYILGNFYDSLPWDDEGVMPNLIGVEAICGNSIDAKVLGDSMVRYMHEYRVFKGESLTVCIPSDMDIYSKEGIKGMFNNTLKFNTVSLNCDECYESMRAKLEEEDNKRRKSDSIKMLREQAESNK